MFCLVALKPPIMLQLVQNPEHGLNDTYEEEEEDEDGLDEDEEEDPVR